MSHGSTFSYSGCMSPRDVRNREPYGVDSEWDPLLLLRWNHDIKTLKWYILVNLRETFKNLRRQWIRYFPCFRWWVQVLKSWYVNINYGIITSLLNKFQWFLCESKVIKECRLKNFQIPGKWNKIWNIQKDSFFYPPPNYKCIYFNYDKRGVG